jgi:general secretion pathway protein F
LVDLGADLPGRLGRIASELGRRLQSGESLARVLADDASTFPAIWKATVAAGIRSGRLAVVLESLATTGRRVAELRRTVAAALVYPIVVLVLAYLVFIFIVTFLAPRLSDALQDLTSRSEPIVTWFVWLGANVGWWVFWPPAILAALLMIEWLAARRGFLSSDGPILRLIAMFWPPIRRSQREARLAAFVEIMALLVREQIPLPEAFELAANASGDAGLRASATNLAQRVQQGQSLTPKEVRQLQIPPLLGFMLATSTNRVELGNALTATAERYRERSSQAALRTALTLPIVLTTIVGGTITLLLGVGTILPIWRLILNLGRLT